MVVTMVVMSPFAQVMDQKVLPLHGMHRPPKEDEQHGHMGLKPVHRTAKLCRADADCTGRAIKTHLF